MNQLDLNGRWQLSRSKSEQTHPATVPGDVVTDLYRAGAIDDPFYRENERNLQWIGETDWVYQRRFRVPASLLKHDRVVLRCEGLDTLATVEINGRRVAQTDNMHRTYEWDVKPLLKAGENTVRVTFASVNRYTRKCRTGRVFKARVTESHPDAYPAYVRKEPCNFGWDWGPILVTAGIWRDISLVGYSTARIEEVAIQQHHAKGRVKLAVSCGVTKLGRGALRTRVTLSYMGQIVAEKTVSFKGRVFDTDLVVDSPRLWWPSGMGKQPLYDLRVELCTEDGEALDATTRRIGLRTLRLDRHKDKWGQSFQFVVNGVPFFAKGANWIPVDALLGRRTVGDYRRLVADAVAANMNMLRVWGGGVYEDDCFYDACDEMGICVWQDFMFACMGYPSWDKAFMKNVRAEAQDNVCRLRHHASLALWCGNNELEQQGVGGKSGISWEDYKAIFDGLLPGVVKELDPQTDYWPSSPHTPVGDRADFNNPNSGDAHLWEVWHGKKPFEWYRTCDHRFNSEFGFQSFPEPRTVRGYTRREDRNITTPVMEHHQRSGIGNTTIMQYMLSWFRLPASFEMTLWASQILQGMAIKYACEHWRRSMPRGMGTLYWQLNDVWPVASWASVDYHGRWKALHYMARHFFCPLLVSGLEDAQKGTVEVHLTSDLLESVRGQVRWTASDALGRKLRDGTINVKTPINASRKVVTLKLADLLEKHTERDLMVWLEMKVKGRPTMTNLVLFGRPKHLQLAENPGISCKTSAMANGEYRLTITAKKAALWAWVELDGDDTRCSDNFIHLRPGQKSVVTLTPARKLTLAQLRKKLRIRSLADTWQ